MCHRGDAAPPAPPSVGPVLDHGPLYLAARDGTRVLAYGARPDISTREQRPGVVILPDVRGLHAYYRGLAVRFAEAGVPAVAIDYYSRNAADDAREDDFDWRTLFRDLRSEDIQTDVAAAVEYLNMAGAPTVFSVGFCYGASQSWRLAASDLALSGCIGFYGRPGLIADVESAIRLPLMLIVAGADAATPQADFTHLAVRLRNSGRACEMHTYEGAPHSFFDRDAAAWRDACEHAWQQVLGFIVGGAGDSAS